MNHSNKEIPERFYFGREFIWGVSTAAYQIEGAFQKDGKGLSIWDTFSNKRGKIFKNQNANVACDFYHRYRDDILLMKKMNIKHFRFSLSWSRILPDGKGPVNPKGIAFYHELIDCLISNGITPWVTLYHWDLPESLQEEGGWTSRKILDYFANYVEICALEFGLKVKNWMVLNEPLVFTGAGYFLGIHAPGKKGLKNFLPAVHHAVLAQSVGARILKNLVPNANIGTTFSCSYLKPYREIKKDYKARDRADILINRLFLEPILGLGYPFEELPVLKKIRKYILLGDMEDAEFDFDFIGIQNYTKEVVKMNCFVPHIKAKLVSAADRGRLTTEMGWEIYPRSIYKMLMKFASYKNMPPILITENGAAFTDIKTESGISDIQRTKYLQDYIYQVQRAIIKGVDVRGYFVWTLMDNFEWAEGYKPRFGLVHVDFETQERTIKDSGYWYSSFIDN